MELTGQRHLPIDRAAAWRALNDPEVLQACIPGCESMERTADNRYALTIAVALGPVRAKFRGRLEVDEIAAPESYTLRFEGEGGAAGFAKGTARVRLAEEDGTRLEYAVKSQVGGRIAQVGNRLIDSAAHSLAENFFAAFEARVSPKAAVPPPAAGPVPRSYRWYLAAAAALIAILLAVLLLR